MLEWLWGASNTPLDADCLEVGCSPVLLGVDLGEFAMDLTVRAMPVCRYGTGTPTAGNRREIPSCLVTVALSGQVRIAEPQST